MNVIHVTTVHRRYDSRIFRKQCVSLAKEYKSVKLVVADVNQNEILQGVEINSIGKFNSRTSRFLKSPIRLWRICKKLNGDIYHFHDPENLLFAVIFKALSGKKIIFDSHEDFPKQLRTKDYLNPQLQFVFAHMAAILERLLLPFFDAVIAATPAIYKKLAPLNNKVVCLQNFPFKEDILPQNPGLIQNKPRAICYIGSMSEIRNIEIILNSISLFKSEVKVIIAGNFSSRQFKEKIIQHKNWSSVDFRGLLDFEGVQNVMAEARLGVVMFKNAPNHIESQPNKLYEYLSASLPVISSNFPLWKDLVEKNNCGVCLEPSDLTGFVNSIEMLIDDESKLTVMGNAGRQIIEETFNWNAEFKKMKQMYIDLSI